MEYKCQRNKYEDVIDESYLHICGQNKWHDGADISTEEKKLKHNQNYDSHGSNYFY